MQELQKNNLVNLLKNNFPIVKSTITLFGVTITQITEGWNFSDWGTFIIFLGVADALVFLWPFAIPILIIYVFYAVTLGLPSTIFTAVFPYFTVIMTDLIAACYSFIRYIIHLIIYGS